jgi:O-antigen/teichoic acid export membrane protein
MLSFVAALFAQPEVILLSFFKNEAQIGYFSAAMKVITIWQIIPQSYLSNIFPLLSRAFQQDDGQTQFIHDKSNKYLLAVSLPICAGLIAAARPIILLLFGPEFEPAVPVLRVLALSVPIFFVSSVLWRVLVANNQQNVVLRVRTITLVVRLITGYGLIALLTSFGAAISTSLNYLISTIMLAWYVLGVGVHLRLVRLSWHFAAASTVMAAIVWLLSDRVSIFLLVPVAGIIYLILILLLRAFSSEDYDLFLRMLPGSFRIPFNRPAVEKE